MAVCGKGPSSNSSNSSLHDLQNLSQDNGDVGGGCTLQNLVYVSLEAWVWLLLTEDSCLTPLLAGCLWDASEMRSTQACLFVKEHAMLAGCHHPSAAMTKLSALSLMITSICRQLLPQDFQPYLHSNVFWDVNLLIKPMYFLAHSGVKSILCLQDVNV